MVGEQVDHHKPQLQQQYQQYSPQVNLFLDSNKLPGTPPYMAVMTSLELVF